jgi:membrane-bound serine protease (ClpP class)
MRRFVLVLLGLAVAALATATLSAAADRPLVRGVEFTHDVDPVTASWLDRELGDAQKAGAEVFVIQMDTPGGLDSSTRDIVRHMESSKIPVAVWVGPNGARAASAGAYISAASNYLGMAPSTNIGSATPISAGGGQDLDQKIVNDAAKRIRAAAETHGRNGAAYEQMVTKKLNLTAAEAVQQNVAEVVAPTLGSFLAFLDGKPGKGTGDVIHTAGASVEMASLPWYLGLLETLIDPTLLTFLLLLGIGGIGYEVFHPGAIVPGVAGGLALLLALMGLAIVPFNWAGIAFILLAFALFAAEAHVGGFGALAVGGIVSLVIGGLILFNAPGQPGVSKPALIIVAIAAGTLFTLLSRAAIRARRMPSSTGATSMVGHLGEARSAIGPLGGQVFVDGELWSARPAGARAIRDGQRVRVIGMKNLVLTVEPDQEAGPWPP